MGKPFCRGPDDKPWTNVKWAGQGQNGIVMLFDHPPGAIDQLVAFYGQAYCFTNFYQTG